MTRYLDAPGIIQAWGDMNDPDQRGRTIVDSLMNTPLLYWASQVTGDERYHRAALSPRQPVGPSISCGPTTRRSTRFTLTPRPARRALARRRRARRTIRAGRGDRRGPCMALRSTMLYTRDESLLQTARRVADYFLAHLPADKVAYWDLIFTDGSGEERDSSASAIAACGLMELAKWLPGEREPLPGSRRLKWSPRCIENYSTRNVARIERADCCTASIASPAAMGVDEGNSVGRLFLPGGADPPRPTRLETVLVARKQLIPRVLALKQLLIQRLSQLRSAARIGMPASDFHLRFMRSHEPDNPLASEAAMLVPLSLAAFARAASVLRHHFVAPFTSLRQDFSPPIDVCSQSRTDFLLLSVVGSVAWPPASESSLLRQLC